MKIQKTNAARLLDKANVPYELVPYAVDENDLSAAHLARQLGLDAARVFKTLVLHGDKSGHFVCILPGDSELDLKEAAKASSNKRCALLPMKDLFPLTGYVRGGCSPLAMKKRFPTYLDESAQLFDAIYISAGQRGLQIKLAPDHLAEQAAAVLCRLC